MTEIYWITRLDAICSLFGGMVFFSIIGIMCIILIYLFSNTEERERKKFSKYIKMLIISFVIGFLGITFIPTTKDVMLIYGLGTMKEYVDNNEKTKELPDKAIDALNKYLDEINESKDSTK